ncbi:2-amino-4-oxopentanoate thiolase subunit OrtB [Petroclostridium sp. X23]|uniref:2-amino-4-oxopentanoate thiolase subunit OrtB n=1 Tax=Petroclostridium sp. X23 TaxID=3045146 RepID=UPI0024ACA602|nr:2-amino-4-oxopentanoate thiolase subunit OrtB [Petroclostridium sp. X23]WHH61244.1 2-amino-4-oxopentanoate thiolase subunit OrtB [Petroclostridium sp. X23]
MSKDMTYKGVISRKNEIMKKAVGIDYSAFESGSIAFDYEKMMKCGYTLEENISIQKEGNVGNTPIIELKNLTSLARKLAGKGKGARIFIKDEACNSSGSFKARRAASALYHAKRLGYKGVIAATSGNYGAAVASQAAMQGLKCIVLQECFDSRKVGQPEILEKQRACEAMGAEVMQLTVGPELFYTFLCLLEETGYFNASLYTPFGIAGIETLGYEIACQFTNNYGRFPDAVVITHAGGGNVTGTARGLNKANANDVKIIAASVDLSGLHMASDNAFNRKSFTTGHTGFGIPFATWPDRSDVPRNAARALRHIDRYVLVKQGEVFYMTEALAALEGLERGPAGNTSLTAAFALAQEMDQDKMIVVQETEYTGAGKHPMPQLSFAKENGIDVRFGNPDEEIPGTNIILPKHPSLIRARDFNLAQARKSYIKNCINHYQLEAIGQEDFSFLIEDTKSDAGFVSECLNELGITVLGLSVLHGGTVI